MAKKKKARDINFSTVTEDVIKSTKHTAAVTQKQQQDYDEYKQAAKSNDQARLAGKRNMEYEKQYNLNAEYQANKKKAQSRAADLEKLNNARKNPYHYVGETSDIDFQNQDRKDKVSRFLEGIKATTERNVASFSESASHIASGTVYKKTNPIDTPLERRNALRGMSGTQFTYKQQEDWRKANADKIEKSKAENKIALQKQANDYSQKAADSTVKEYSGAGKIEKVAHGVADTITDMGEQALLGHGNMLVGMGISGFGQSAGDARRSGATEGKQILAGISNGAIQVGTERLSAFVKPIRALQGGKAGLLDKLGEDISYKISKKAVNSAVGTSLINRGVDKELVYKTARNITRGAVGIAGEGGEEVAADLLQPITDTIYNGKTFGQNFKTDANPKQLASDFGMGALAAGVLGGAAHLTKSMNDITLGKTAVRASYTDDEKNKWLKAAKDTGEDSEPYKMASNLEKQQTTDGHIYDSQIDKLALTTIQEETNMQKSLQLASDDAYKKNAEDNKAIAGDTDFVRYDKRINTEAEENEVNQLYAGKVLDTAESAKKNLIASGVNEKIADIQSIAIGRIINGTPAANDMSIAVPGNIQARNVIENMTGVTLPATNKGTIAALRDYTVAAKVKTSEEIVPQAQENVKNNMAQLMSSMTSGMDDKESEIYKSGLSENNITQAATYANVYNQYRKGGEISGRNTGNLKYEDIHTGNDAIVPERVRRAAFEAGVKLGQEKKAEANNLSNTNVNLSNRKSGRVTANPKAVKKIGKGYYNAFVKLADIYGVDVVIKENLGNNINGYYKDGTIYISASAKNPFINIWKHEFTHHLQATAPKEYQELKEFVFSEFYNKDPEKYAEAITKKVELYAKNGVKIGQEEAEDEILADSTDVFSFDENLVNTIVSEYKSLGQKLKDGIVAALDILREVSSKAKSTANYGDYLNELNIAEKANRLWIKASNASIGVEAENGGKEQYKIASSLKSDLRKVYNNSFDKNKGELYIGTTSKFLTNVIGVTPLSVTMPAAKAYSSMVSQEKAKLDNKYDPDINYHSLGIDGLIDALNASENPVIAYVSPAEKDQKRLNRITLVTDMKDANGDAIIVVEKLEADAKLNSKRIQANKVITAFGKENLNAQINYAIRNNQLLFVDKKRSHSIYGGAEGQSLYGRKNDFTNNILDFLADVKYEKSKKTGNNVNTFGNTSNSPIGDALKKAQAQTDANVKNTEEKKDRNDKQFSIGTNDSEGNKLSEQQQEFFKDSKVVDDKGNLKVMYHGTSRADRVGTVFDPKRATSGPMAYFTDNPEIAKNYSTDKDDTSLAYEDNDYYNQFFVMNDGEEIPLVDYWHRLTAKQKNDINKKAGMLSYDDDMEGFELQKGNTRGNGGYKIDPVLERNNRGNAFKSLIDAWLQSGDLFNEEKKFLDILKMVGVDNVSYDDPNYREEKVYKVYLNIKNGLNTADINKNFTTEVRKWLDNANLGSYKKESANADMWDKNNSDPYEWLEKLEDDIDNGTTYAWTTIPDAITDFLKSHEGYDGVIDKGGKYTSNTHMVAVPFYSEQIKSVDNENPTENQDIRFQIADKEHQEAEKKISNLEKEVAKLKGEFKLSKTVSPDDKETNRKISQLIKSYSAEMNGKIHSEVKEYVNRLYKEMNKPNPNWGYIQEEAKDAASIIARNATYLQDDGMEAYSELKKALKGVTLKIGETNWNDAPDINDYKKSIFGIVNIAKNKGVPIDTFYEGLAEEYPHLFNPEEYSTPMDQLYNIVDAVQSQQPYYETFSEGMAGEMTNDIAEDIVKMTFALKQNKSFADRKADEKKSILAKAKAEHKTLMANQQQRYRDRLNKQDRYYKDKIAKIKQDNRDKKNKKYYTERITTYAQWLADSLLRPTETKHIPDGYQKALAKALSGFDFSTKFTDRWEQKYGKQTRKVMHWSELRDQFAKFENMEGSEIEYDDGLKTLLDAVSKTENKRFDDLTMDELNDMYHAIKMIRFSMSNMNKAFSDGVRENISDMGESVINEAKSFREEKQSHSGFVSTVGDFLNESNINPIDKFVTLGGTLEKLYMNLRKGFDKHIDNCTEIKNFTEGLVKSKDYDIKKWTGDKAKSTKYQMQNGKEIELTPAQVMSLYCLMNRPQAVEHILGSGITAAPVTAVNSRMQRLTKNLFAKTVSSRQVMATVDDINNILSSMTKEQKAVADKIQNFMATTCAEWGNETSLKLYGYKKFVEREYFPIKSSDAFINETFDKKQPSKIKNIGFTKDTVMHANNPIVIDDIFNVFTQHAATMSQYNALVPGITDFERVFNFKPREGGIAINSVQKQMEVSYGKSTNDYIKTFMADVNQNYARIKDHSLFNTMFANVKKGTLGLNLRVFVQQPTAIMRAGAVMDQKYLANPGNFAMSKEEMFEHCPIARWKSWGFYNTDVSRNMNDIFMDNKGITDDIFMGAYGFADNITWAYIWQGVKKEIKATRPELEKGTPDYWQAVNDRFSYVVDRTQVVDSVFHRSQFMRRTDIGSKLFTAFMAEPTKTYNMLRTELVLAGKDLKDGHKGKATARTSRVIAVFIANAAAVSAASALLDALRDGIGGGDDEDKNKKFLDKWISYSKQNMWTNAGVWNLLPFSKDITSLFMGYDVSRMDLEGFVKLQEAVTTFTKPNITTIEKIKKFSQAVSDLTGVPIYNLMRDSEAGYIEYVRLSQTPEIANYESKKLKFKLGADKNYGQFAKTYVEAMSNNDTESAEYILSDMVSGGYDEKKIIKSYVSKFSKDNKDKLTTAAENFDTSTLKALQTEYINSGMEKEKAYNKVKYAVNKVYNDAIDKEDWKTAEKAIKAETKMGYYVYDKKLRSSMSSAYYDAYETGHTAKANRIKKAMEDHNMFSDDSYYTKESYMEKNGEKSVAINKIAKKIAAGDDYGATILAKSYASQNNWKYDSLMNRAKTAAKKLKAQ